MPLSDRWLWCPVPRPDARMRLVCFPHAGGAASAYRGWPKRIPADVELHAVRYPGRAERYAEPCIDHMDGLADAIIDVVRPMASKPVAFFGHSMGASIAHEVAVRFERVTGTVPEGLFVSARPAPHRLPRYTVHELDDDALVAEVRRLSVDGGAALDDPELRELVLPAIRADYRLVGNYRPPRIDRVHCPIMAYVGDADPEVAADDIRHWRDVTTDSFDCRTFPGDHFYLAPNENELVDDVGRRLLGRDDPVENAAAR